MPTSSSWANFLSLASSLPIMVMTAPLVKISYTNDLPKPVPHPVIRTCLYENIIGLHIDFVTLRIYLPNGIIKKYITKKNNATMSYARNDRVKMLTMML